MRIFDGDEERYRAITATPVDIQRDLIDNNAYLFSKAARKRYDLTDFIERFMRSKIAEILDMELNKYMWEGPESLLADFELECAQSGMSLKKSKYTDIPDLIHEGSIGEWIGYIYRLTHFKTAESSKEIVDFMPAEMMTRAYYTGHCEDPDGWIENYTLKNDIEKYGKYYFDPEALGLCGQEEGPHNNR